MDFNKKSNVLFVTSDQRVFGFGNNRRGCLGLGHDRPILTPEVIPQLCNYNIQYFVNGCDFVLAVNDMNIIYGFGCNVSGQLARTDRTACLKSEIISYFNNIKIIKLSCGTDHTLALSSDGRVYAWGWNKFGQIGCGDNNEYICTPIEIQFQNSHKIQSIYCFYCTSFAITSDGHVFSWGNNRNNQLGHNISDEKVRVVRGTVLKVKHRLDDKIYAIKRVQFGDFSEEKKQNILKEVKSLSKLDSEYVVKYYHSWLESNHLFIQMEFCSQSLKSLLEVKPIVFERQPEDKINSVFEYYISCEIFKEILECVQYLHESDPIVIHRDLKPDNILLEHNTRFNRFIKLCDFGLATDHNINRQTASRYDHTLDIYSLALIAEEIYSIDPQLLHSCQAIESEFNKYYNNLYQTLQSMQSSPDYKQRPDCREISKLHVFNDYDEKSNVLFVTSDQRVFGFGNNFRGCLGLGHDTPILPPPHIIPQLCHQNIQYFVNGYDFVLAVNDMNIIYGFGNNQCGQLAQIGYIGKACLKPEKISYFNNINIIKLNCGAQHTLALSSDGRVYAWGWNKFGQIGCGDKNEFICTPIEIQFNDNHKIQSIYGCHSSSFAITFGGYVFSWGNNTTLQLGHNITADKIFKPRLISSINDMMNLERNKLNENKTNYNSFIDIYANECQITYNTINMNKLKEKIVFSQNKSETKSENKNKNKSDCNSSDSIYKSQFIETSTIGSGGFGTVFKVKHRLDDKIYAIKRVQFGVLNEVKSLAKLDSDFVVKYYDSWIECNYLYIQMEFCELNLTTILENKAIVFGRQPEDHMNSVFEYFISCEIFKEILECVQYLHESKPPVIHRDLKPDNILIDLNFRSNCFIKLCDFGLAKETSGGQTASYSVVGTSRYMAPEVYSGKYNHKSDIYSLNIIDRQLFDIDLQVSQSFNENESLKSCKLCIYETLLSMMSTPFWQQRPECREVLAKYNEWSIDKTFIKDHKEFNSTTGWTNSPLLNPRHNPPFGSPVKDFERKSNVLFVTSDQRVFGFGNNFRGCLGFGHNNPILSPQIIPQLCHQNIQYFVNGSDFVLAVNDMNIIYGVGCNRGGQLARSDYIGKHSLKPEIISHFNDINIIKLSCGAQHTLALSSDGRVYAWGWNKFGQIGCGVFNEGLTFIPVATGCPVDSNSALNSTLTIYIKHTCKIYRRVDGTTGRNDGTKQRDRPNGRNDGTDRRDGTTGQTDGTERRDRPTGRNDGTICPVATGRRDTYYYTNIHQKVFGFGNNYRGCLGLGHDNPILTPEVIPQLCHQNIQYFVNGCNFVLAVNDMNIIYGFGSNYDEQLARSDNIGKHCLKPKIISYFNDINIIKLSCGYEHTLALSSDGRVYAWGWNKFGQIGCEDNNKSICTPIEIQFINSHKIQSIYCSYCSSFAITSDGHVFSWGDNRFNELGHNISNDKKQFLEISTVGSGGFGTVFKVKHRLDDKIYAVKRVQFEDFSAEKKLRVLNEVKSLSKLESDFVVKYYHSWIECNYLYIQMEFCELNLTTILKNKANVFERQPEDQMNSVFEYFISCEIFKELLECVQYLHESNPLIIHRDLKPDNILIDPNFKSNRFIKLCDFGLAKEINIDGHTSSRYGHSVVGTIKYMSPETHLGKPYTHKSDIYSLYVIGEQLFNVDLQATQTFVANDSEFKTSLECIYRTLLAMMSTPNWRQRPESRQVLANYKEWSIDNCDCN
ncbi:unnamed protein product [Medioppia subpectinata]|uniref:Protein kinase domain-containing protein n=1 Tax=Medioppia subpectinata TaxID=1979941 RepID=A0A7R9KDK4_9ACAR|nr:unnamed protein product [Medioppia subpectinata]CAG2100146.1 unnamed protein product [Medioppia subpectinata]